VTWNRWGSWEHVQHNKDNNNQGILKHKAFLTQIIKDSDINDQYIISNARKEAIMNLHSSFIKCWKLKIFQWINVINIWMSCVSLIYIPKVSIDNGKIVLHCRIIYLSERDWCRNTCRFRLNIVLSSHANYRQLKNDIYDGC